MVRRRYPNSIPKELILSVIPLDLIDIFGTGLRVQYTLRDGQWHCLRYTNLGYDPWREEASNTDSCLEYLQKQRAEAIQTYGEIRNLLLELTEAIFVLEVDVEDQENDERLRLSRDLAVEGLVKQKRYCEACLRDEDRARDNLRKEIRHIRGYKRVLDAGAKR